MNHIINKTYSNIRVRLLIHFSMSRRIDEKAEHIIESLDLPQDLFLGFPCISFTGNRELYISNHRGLLAYESECIIVLAKPFQIQIHGRNLYIEAYSKEEILIKGYIHSMEFC